MLTSLINFVSFTGCEIEKYWKSICIKNIEQIRDVETTNGTVIFIQ